MIISVDTNLLFFALAKDRPEHRSTTAFINSLQDREEVLLSELILVELYRLLRNPAVVSKPLSASEATEVVQIWRQHPRWKITGFPPHSRDLHDTLWKLAAGSAFGYRRIYDARLALTLLQYG
jgi:uncharacterized protein